MFQRNIKYTASFCKRKTDHFVLWTSEVKNFFLTLLGAIGQDFLCMLLTALLKLVLLKVTDSPWI